jgi:hypothetical protein
LRNVKENKMDKYKLFLEKLTALTKETGIVIENFGDRFYNPKLIFSNENLSLYFTWDYEKEKYITASYNRYKEEFL